MDYEEMRGRGPEAVTDMKARITALRRQGADIVDVLWERHRRAIMGDGYVYDAIGRLESLRQDGERGQPPGR